MGFVTNFVEPRLRKLLRLLDYKRLSVQTSIFGVVFYVFKSLLGDRETKETSKNYRFDPKASEQY